MGPVRHNAFPFRRSVPLRGRLSILQAGLPGFSHSWQAFAQGSSFARRGPPQRATGPLWTVRSACAGWIAPRVPVRLAASDRYCPGHPARPWPGRRRGKRGGENKVFIGARDRETPPLLHLSGSPRRFARLTGSSQVRVLATIWVQDSAGITPDCQRSTTLALAEAPL